MNASEVFAATMLNAGDALFNGGALTFYSGTMPSTPETALSGNTPLCSFTFASTAFSNAAFASSLETSVATFVSNTASPSSSGVCTFARAVKSDGTTVLADYTVASSGSPDIMIGSTSIQTGVSVVLSSFQQKLPAL